MRAMGTGTTAWLLTSTLLLSCPILSGYAQAAPREQASEGLIAPSLYLHGNSLESASGSPSASHTPGRMSRRVTRGYGISCVPYARQVSGIMVVGNAWQWWQHAEGRYARGDRPEVGSVLNFRAIGRMHLGHVAVVTQVVNPREVLVDHANWPSGVHGGAVMRKVAVVDVSEANNWSAVRVELGRSGTFGAIYPTYGFIYNRPDTGFVIAKVARPAPEPEINEASSDLRPKAERPWHTVEEVAEAPARAPRRIDLSLSSSGQ